MMVVKTRVGLCSLPAVTTKAMHGVISRTGSLSQAAVSRIKLMANSRTWMSGAHSLEALDSNDD